MRPVFKSFWRPNGPKTQRARLSSLFMRTFVAIFILLPFTAQGALSQEGVSMPKSGSVAWDIQVVDGPKWFYNMTDRSMAFKSDGTPCIAYGGDHLYYTCYNFTTLVWDTVTVDSVWKVGSHAALAFNNEDKPYITY